MASEKATPMPVLMTPTEVAEFLGYSRETVYDYIAKNLLPSVKINGRIRVPQAALGEWLDQQSEQALAKVQR